jgi:pyruvate formate lyase activating enzyme
MENTSVILDNARDYDIHIKGVQRSSFIDYPGKISAVVFLNKCNFRCPFCHNPELVFDENSDDFPDITVDEFMRFLAEKKKWIDGVCITGGEPTLHKGLIDFMQLIKGKGFLVKLDTNGTMPAVVEKAIREGVVDYIAMDVKNTFEFYDDTVKAKVNTDSIKKSISIIMDAGEKGLIDYEFRTTILPKYHDIDSLKKIAQMISGSKRYALQQFKPEDALVDSGFITEASYRIKEIEQFAKIFEPHVKEVLVRG